MQPHNASVLSVFAHLTPQRLIGGVFGHCGYPFLHLPTVASPLFDPGHPVISAQVWVGIMVLLKLP